MKRGLKAFCIYLVLPAFLAMIFNNFTNNNLVIANVVFYFVVLIYFLILSRKDIINDLHDLKKNIKIYIKSIIMWISVGFVLMILSNYLIHLFINNLPNNEMNNRFFLTESPISYLIYLLLIAPMIEEYVFRFSFKGIKNYYVFTFFTSILFATLHILSITNWNQLWYIIPYFVLSFGFANVYFKTKNYFATVIGHIIHNALCVIIILLF